MKKRSALMVAAGLIVTLIVGGLAVGLGFTGPSVSEAEPQDGRVANEPLVRTVRRTLTVHRTAGSPRSDDLPLASTDTSSPSPSASDDAATEDVGSEGSDDRGSDDERSDDERSDEEGSDEERSDEERSDEERSDEERSDDEGEHEGSDDD